MLLFMLLAVPVVMVASLPLFAHTSTYPVAIVDGNSMYPALHNGDVVYYAAPRGPLANGTIIIFIQGETGVSSIDSLLKPILIHRIIGFGYQSDGSLYYETKGDNNAQPDPFVTSTSSVLGVETASIPFLGLPIQFFKTAYGMLTIVSAISLYFFSGVDTRNWLEDQKNRLLSVFAKHSLDGSIGAEQFDRLKLVVECADIPEDSLKDTTLVSLSKWLRTGGLEEDWKEETATCPKCGNPSYNIVSGEGSLVVCPTCMGHNKRATGPESDAEVDRPWAGLSFMKPSRTGAIWSSSPSSSGKMDECGAVCPTHKIHCVHPRNHPSGHHHLDLKGDLCLFG